MWEEVRFKSADGTPLTGMWFPARGVPAAKGVIVHFHGNGANMTGHFPYVQWLAPEGYDALVFDYRGYGASGGRKSLSGAIEDGAAALRVARGRAGGARERLIVLGQSLGGAIALASLERDGGEGVRGVVIDSSFASYRGVARSKLWIAGLLVSDRWAPRRLAARRKPVPLLVMHADGDPVVPYAQGRALFESAAGPKEFWKVEGRGHAEGLFARGASYRPPLLAWLERALRN